jgi:formylmethanofuran dehydrogenase subunit E
MSRRVENAQVNKVIFGGRYANKYANNGYVMVDLKNSFEADLELAARVHGHLCAGQYIGVRMARLGCARLDIAEPHSCRDLFVFVEVDRCLTDAIMSVTGCKPGKRRLKHIDYGKSAATFVNNATGEAVRVASRGWVGPLKDDDLYCFFSKTADSELFNVENVRVEIPRENLPGPPCERVLCERCGEFVTDSRHVFKDGKTLCRACSDGAYYKSLP